MALPTAGCSATVSRVCTDSMHSAVCQMSGNVWVAVPDRTCPPGSTCAGGFCDPPTAGTCVTTNACVSVTPNTVCNQYANTGTLTGHCTMSITGSNQCSAAGYTSKCSTGICVQTSGGFGCLEPCTVMADCKMGKHCLGVTAPTDIEGASTAALKTCQ